MAGMCSQPISFTQGTIRIAPRPLPPIHVPIIAGMTMTNSSISVAKYSNDRHQIWHDALASFKTKLIRILGFTLEGTIGSPPDESKLLSVQKIVDEVKTKYGTVGQMAFAKMEDVLNSPLDHVTNLDNLRRLNSMFSCKQVLDTSSKSTTKSGFSGSLCRATTK
jgi:hypothetical protein